YNGLQLHPPTRHPPPRQHHQHVQGILQGRLQLAIRALARLLVPRPLPTLRRLRRGQSRQAICPAPPHLPRRPNHYRSNASHPNRPILPPPLPTLPLPPPPLPLH